MSLGNHYLVTVSNLRRASLLKCFVTADFILSILTNHIQININFSSGQLNVTLHDFQGINKNVQNQ